MTLSLTQLSRVLPDLCTAPFSSCSTSSSYLTPRSLWASVLNIALFKHAHTHTLMWTHSDAHSRSLWWLRSPDRDELRQVSIMTVQAGGTWRDEGLQPAWYLFHRFVTAHDADVGLSHLIFLSVKMVHCVFPFSRERPGHSSLSCFINSVLKIYCDCHATCSVMFPDYLVPGFADWQQRTFKPSDKKKV